MARLSLRRFPEVVRLKVFHNAEQMLEVHQLTVGAGSEAQSDDVSLLQVFHERVPESPSISNKEIHAGGHPQTGSAGGKGGRRR